MRRRSRSLAWLALTLGLACGSDWAAASVIDTDRLLAARTECVSFRWDGNPGGSAQGSISVPVTLNGRPMWFQLDTGTNTDILYSSIADAAGWAAPSDKSFRAASLLIGTTRIPRARIAVWRDQPVAETSGEIGLADLAGRIAVLDYPARRFCLFEPGEAPEPIMAAAHWVEADLRNGKLFVPVSGSTFASRSIVFDTGSSELPLWLDLTTWRRLTGLRTTRSATQHVRGTAFTKPVTFDGAPAKGSLRIGDIDLGPQIVFTKDDAPTMFAGLPFPADGIMGNAPMTKYRIIIDLAEGRTRLGVVAP